MSLQVSNVEIPIEEGSSTEVLSRYVSDKLGIPGNVIKSLQIKKKSLDARRKGRIKYVYQLHVEVDGEESLIEKSQTSDVIRTPEVKSFHPVDGLDLSSKVLSTPPVIIGSGPAGIFAALALAEAGQRCIIVERGEPVEARMRTVGRLRRAGQFEEESNFCFGEGGAGTFSDGKLTCGRNHPLVRYLFEKWVEFGAPADILYNAHPHIGTDYLMILAKNMRLYLESRGCKFLFGTRFEDFKPGASARYEVSLSNGDRIETDHLVMAIGHSARDTYRLLLERGLAIQPKPFAIGARFEHPQEDIDRIQYGSCELLPAAEYKLAARAGDRGIWTFCMCPGGLLMPTGAQPGHLAINGMSYHARNSGFANAAVVVNVNREDFYRGHVLDGVTFQENIEKAAFIAGGSNYSSPAQRLTDFLKGRETKGSLESTYKPGVNPARIDKLLPKFVVDSLKGALGEYNKKMHGYISDRAIVAGVESKTSSPIVMTRDAKLMSVSHPGFYPCGEGAGFAGGIVSASLDGVKVARALLENAIEDGLVQSLH
jgi:uncharacterized FAD-dependent dehydrogenase